MWRVVRGNDGRVLGIVRGSEIVRRGDYNSWDTFVHEAGVILMASLPVDRDSREARTLIKRDDERIRELYES